MREAIEEKVRGVAAGERRSIVAACERLMNAIGPEAFRRRVERRWVGERGDMRAHELVIDGAVVVWRGEWIAVAPLRGRWETRWLVEPERLGST